MTDTEAGLSGSWLYSTDLFDRETILRMASHFETFLRNALAAPDARLSAIELFSEEEKQQRGVEKKQRKQSQLKKLLTVEPKAVTLPHSGGDKE
jgi:non-ribosomal peptide synthetase component F